MIVQSKKYDLSLYLPPSQLLHLDGQFAKRNVFGHEVEVIETRFYESRSCRMD
jgi:hypothetical protein